MPFASSILTAAARPVTTLRYVITASCMRNNGAWAKVLGSQQDYANAKLAFKNASWPGTGLSGREWGREISLTAVRSDGTRVQMEKRDL